MPQNRRLDRLLSFPAILSILVSFGCGGGSGTSSGGGSTTLPPAVVNALSSYNLTGDVSFVHDPSVIRQGTTYYAFTTDPGGATGPGIANGMQMRCSTDKVTWKICGIIFPNGPPAYITARFPGFTTFWAPDVSYFNGLYHVYYTASGFGFNGSIIGLATTPTLDPNDPAYLWTDHGQVLASYSQVDNFNAIDANILVDTDSSGNFTHVWMQYGSFWNGIFQQEIDPLTGMLASNATPNNIAQRTGVANDPIEGSSLVHKNGFYYLFASFDYCCNSNYTRDNYKIAVGRSTSPNGPFVDQSGVPMLQGGGTLLLQGNASTWGAPGGETVYIDPVDGDLITFHALNLQQNGLPYLFVKTISWTGDWPTIQP